MVLLKAFAVNHYDKDSIINLVYKSVEDVIPSMSSQVYVLLACNNRICFLFYGQLLRGILAKCICYGIVYQV